jgi:hypothetical protein
MFLKIGLSHNGRTWVECLTTGAEKNLCLKMEEVTGDQRKIHAREFRDLYNSPNLIPVSKSTKYVGV